MNKSDRLGMAQWILERNIHWIGAAETKCGAIVAIDTAMLGVLASAFSGVERVHRTTPAIFWAILAAALLIAGVYCSAMSLLPRINGPVRSFIFFGRIVEKSEAEYRETFHSASEDDFLTDCMSQIHRNADIACEKYRWVRASMRWSFGALLPWVLAVTLLV